MGTENHLKIKNVFHDHSTTGLLKWRTASESGLLDGDGRTSSASQRCTLHLEVVIPKFCPFGRTSKAFTPCQLCDYRSSCSSAKLQCTLELGKLRFFGSK